MHGIVKVARAAAFAVRSMIAVPLPAQRIAATACLPAALASVLVGIFPAPCTAAARPDLQARLQRVANNSSITLQLVDGRAVSGAFYGFLGDWRDSVDSSTRYESWRRAHPEGLPRLGESLTLVLGSGGTLRGSFEGAGPTFLALGSGSSGTVNLFAFGDVAAARSDSGGPVVSWADLRGRLLDAPPLIGIGLMRGDHVVVIPRESIFSVIGIGYSAPDSPRLILILLALGVTVALVLVCVNQAANGADRTSNGINNSTSTCGNKTFDDIGSTCQSMNSSSRSYDRKFGASNVSRGLDPWPAGETRRP